MAAGSRCVKLLFDETIGHPVAQATIQLLKFDTTLDLDAVTMKEYSGLGTKDPFWALRAANENRFVITGDRGEKKDGAPLDLLLPYHQVSAAFMTGTLHGQRSQFEKMRAVLTLWPKIVEAVFGPPGMRYAIKIAGDGYALDPWPLNEQAKRRQTELLGKFPDNLWEAKYAKPATS